jgi:RND family efflux transporter MFP subunit
MQSYARAAVALGLAGLLAGAGCGQSEAPAQGRNAPRPALIEVEPAGEGDLTDGWSFLGQVQPAMAAELASAASGHVLSVNVREGDAVTKGQVLLTLDSAKVRAQLASAEARLEGIKTELVIAERQLERLRPLEFPTITETERERFELTVATLRAQLATQTAEVQQARVERAHHTLRAPFSGAVKARRVDPGAWVSVGQPVLELVSLEELEIHVDVSAELGGRLEVGGVATLVGNGRVSAEIAGVVPALDTATRTMRVRLVPSERPPWLIAGMAVDVEFEVRFEGQGVTVSRDALLRSAVGVRLVKYADGAAVPVPVEVIATAEGRALVRGEGLAPGDLIIVRGNERLRPGQPVQVKE